MLIGNHTSSVKSSRQLLAENAKLRAHEFLLEAKLQKLLSVERQNVQLKALLQSGHYLSKRVMSAELLAVHMRQGIQQVIVNKGQKTHYSEH